MPWCQNLQGNKFYRSESTCTRRVDCCNCSNTYAATASSLMQAANGHFWKYHLLLHRTPFLKTTFSCKFLTIALFRWKCLLVTHKPLKYADHVMNFICMLIDLPVSLKGLIVFPTESHNPIYGGLFWLWDGGGDGQFFDCSSIVPIFGMYQHLPFCS